MLVLLNWFSKMFSSIPLFFFILKAPQTKHTLPCKFKDVVDEVGSVSVTQDIRIDFQLFD